MDRVPLTKSEQMARVRSRDTEPELALRRAIWRLGLRYGLHSRLPGSPDLVLARYRTVVFVDGCFWHGCPEHYRSPAANAEFWLAKLERNIGRDRRVDAELNALGWTVLRVWEHEITADAEHAAQTVKAALTAAETQAR